MNIRELIANRFFRRDIPRIDDPPEWNSARPDESLRILYEYGERQARSVTGWYYSRKTWKAYASSALRYATIIATAIGGLMPVLISTNLFGVAGNDPAAQLRLQQWGYFSVGLAALFLALDRYSGASTGWMRYIITAMAAETALEQFRFTRIRMAAELGARTPSTAELEVRIQHVNDFVNTLRTLVEKETQDWASEFKANLAQLDKDTQALVASARVQVEEMKKANAEKERAARPGSIDLSVENVLETDAGYTVEIDGKERQTKITSKSCGIHEVPVGIREVSVKATIGGDEAHALQLAEVKAEQITKVTLLLSKTKAVGRT